MIVIFYPTLKSRNRWIHPASDRRSLSKFSDVHRHLQVRPEQNRLHAVKLNPHFRTTISYFCSPNQNLL